MCNALPRSTKSAFANTVPASATDVLLEHLGFTRRTTAEVQDLYSRPAQPSVAPPVPQHVARRTDAPRRLHPQPVREPDLDAA
jgi:hypothetical protein